MRLLYTLGISLYSLAIRLVSVKNQKAKLWIDGRKNWKRDLKNAMKNNTKPVVWVHCSSLGEFEQGRPVIESIKEKSDNLFILLTFFSPSGYEIRKKYAHADYVCYLPSDTIINSINFVTIANPTVALFVKYEFWYNYLKVLKNRNIPVWLISGIFRPSHHFFKWWGFWFRKQLNCFDHFFLQNQASAQLLDKINIKNYTIGGDTRFDRVIQVAQNGKEIEIAKTFKNNKFTIVAGSTWQADEDILTRYINESVNDFKYIIAPHEIDKEHVQQIVSKISKKTIKYSEVNTNTDLLSAKVLIIDNIGMLSTLYRYADLVMIGGGFGKGIHNILEPSVFGVPIIIGPNYQKFNEAVELVKRETVFTIKSYNEFSELVNNLSGDKVRLKKIFETQNQYIKAMSGSTTIIVNQLLSITETL